MNYMKGIYHVHCEDSRYDSTMNVKQMCQKAKELGYEAIALTDHGTVTAIDDFVIAARAAGIKPIPGVEVYMQEDNSQYGRLHMVLVALDDLGYQGISKIVTQSNLRIDDRGFPRVSKEILETYCSEGKLYHGHIIASSACVGGVLAGILISSLGFDKEINKVKKSQEKYENPDSVAFRRNLESLKDKEATLEELKEQRDYLTKLSKRPFKKRENQLVKLEGTKSYHEEYEKLLAEKAESEGAKEKLNHVRILIAATNRDITSIKNRIKDAQKAHVKYQELEKRIQDIEAKKLPFDELYQQAKDEALYYNELFGKGNFFIEIQYHGYLGDNKEPIEKAAFTCLANMAKETNIPLIAGQDAHMVDGSPESIRARQIIRSLKYAQAVSVSKGDEELYIKDEESFRIALENVLPQEDIDQALKNTYEVCARSHCTFEYGTHYPKYAKLKPNETAIEALKALAYENISYRYSSADWNEEKKQRLKYELRIIADMGYSDYFLIEQDKLRFGRSLGYLSEKSLQYLTSNIKSMSLKEFEEYVELKKELPGYVIGPGRGSAAGSLVAYLVGITDIDPIKYHLLFERFLNPSRISMPDIDSDFSPDIRALVVEYCKKLYGVESVANIVTKGYIAPKGAIRNVGRVLGIEKGREEYYLRLSDKIAKLIPNTPGTKFADCEADLRNSFQIKKSDFEERRKLCLDANELIDQAKLMEGTFLNYGMHAAGVIIADGNPISDYVALMKDEKSGDMKVQCDMVQTEEIHGLLKFDFLGLRNLKIITMAIRSIKKRLGILVNVNDLPHDPNVYRNIFSSAKTGSVFQFESGGIKAMLRSARPDCLADLIALVSLYRPGPMDYIPKYIESKFNPERIEYLCKELEPILKATYGVIIYQEQVMSIVQKLAGYSLADADNVRRFMSKKKYDKLEHERKAFIEGDEDRGIEGCIKRGISKAVAETLFDQMIDFAKYAFNKSHAAAYATIAYITAYLKYHYPVDYMCAVLNCTDKLTKIPSVLNDCREMGVITLPPEINKSKFGFSIHDDKILFGLDSIKGRTAKVVTRIIEEREKHGSFVSFKELLLKNILDKSTCEGMIAAGAFDEFNPNRMALQHYYKDVIDLVKNIHKKTDDIMLLSKDLEGDSGNAAMERKLKKAKDALDVLYEQLDVVRIINCSEDMKYKLKLEKEVLGFFVSRHPMEEYREPEELGCIPIDDLVESRKNISIVGLIESLQLKKTKNDKPMAIFALEDKTGLVEVCCFPKCFERYREYIQEDEVVKLTGKVEAQEIHSFSSSNEEDGEESVKVRLQFYPDKISEVKPDASSIKVKVRSMLDFNESLNKMRDRDLLSNYGHPLVIWDMLTGEFRRTRHYIKPEIIKDKDFETTMTD